MKNDNSLNSFKNLKIGVNDENLNDEFDKSN